MRRAPRGGSGRRAKRSATQQQSAVRSAHARRTRPIIEATTQGASFIARHRTGNTVIFLLLIVAAAQLFNLQVPQAAGLRAEAAGQLKVTDIEKAVRGSIVDRNLSALSPQIKALLIQLSPMSVIDQVRAPIHLMHDRNDQSIPFTQAQEFAAALARLHHPYDFAAYGIFSHVQVRSNIATAQLLSDGARLFQTLNSILLVGS